nr:MAG TPA: hypothetical protein [Caudoviricetes sp.]
MATKKGASFFPIARMLSGKRLRPLFFILTFTETKDFLHE